MSSLSGVSRCVVCVSPGSFITQHSPCKETWTLACTRNVMIFLGLDWRFCVGGIEVTPPLCWMSYCYRCKNLTREFCVLVSATSVKPFWLSPLCDIYVSPNLLWSQSYAVFARFLFSTCFCNFGRKNKVNILKYISNETWIQSRMWKKSLNHFLHIFFSFLCPALLLFILGSSCTQMRE